MNWNIEKVSPERASALLTFLYQLDSECEYMLYEPGERQANGHDLRGHIRSLKENSVIMACHVDQVGYVGYLALYGGRLKRCAHVASLSCGVLKAWRCKGIASSLWLEGLCFCKKVGIEKVELTVVQDNHPAASLYMQWGFEIEGLRLNSFGDHRENEYYMGLKVGK
jgi:ribosomal protein S18 acetylase RimI-like enzyme